MRNQTMKHHSSVRPGFLRQSLIAVLLLTVIGAAGFAGWWYFLRAKPLEVEKGTQPDVKAPDKIPVPIAQFKDITRDAHIDFRHVNSSDRNKLLPETMGGGVAVFDFDGDGKQDILFINSCYWPGEEKQQAPPTL